MVRLTKNVGSSIEVSVEGETYAEAFEQMAMIEECYEPNPNKESDGDFRHRVRDVTDDKGEEFRYYELYDASVKARLSLGQYKQKDKTGFMFPKRKDGEKWLDNRGWVIWTPNQNSATQNEKPAAAKATAGNKKPKVTADVDTPF